MQREFRNTRIDEAITAVVAAADAVAPATTGYSFMLRLRQIDISFM